MRKLVYGINVSMDGCCDHTRFGGGEDIHEYFTDLLRGADLIIYGRKTYELMVPFWPEVAREQSMSEPVNAFAKVFDNIEKIVVSRTLHKVDDVHTTIMQGDLKTKILELKQQPGKDISTGGVALPAQLIAMGLVDEFHLVVHPVIVGEGRRLFTELKLPETIGLKLAESKTFGSGCIALRYDLANHSHQH